MRIFASHSRESVQLEIKGMEVGRRYEAHCRTYGVEKIE